MLLDVKVLAKNYDCEDYSKDEKKDMPRMGQATARSTPVASRRTWPCGGQNVRQVTGDITCKKWGCSLKTMKDSHHNMTRTSSRHGFVCDNLESMVRHGFRRNFRTILVGACCRVSFQPILRFLSPRQIYDRVSTGRPGLGPIDSRKDSQKLSFCIA